MTFEFHVQNAIVFFLNNETEFRYDYYCCLQSITGIDDDAEAIFHLEECNWDLLVIDLHILNTHTYKCKYVYVYIYLCTYT